MDSLCEHETFKSICGICHRDNVITRLTAENERLREEVKNSRQEHAILVEDIDAEIERLRGQVEFERKCRNDAFDELKKQDAEIERLRAALEDCLSWHDYSNDMHKPIEVRAAYMRARAALEEK